VSVWCAHHGDLDVLIAQTSDTTGPFALDRRAAFEFEAQLLKKVTPSSSTTIPMLSIRLSAIFRLLGFSAYFLPERG
jgi:hypothetical protein